MQSPKEALDPLELELQRLLAATCMLGIEHKLNTSPLQEQLVFLASEPSFKPQNLSFFLNLCNKYLLSIYIYKLLFLFLRIHDKKCSVDPWILDSRSRMVMFFLTKFSWNSPTLICLHFIWDCFDGKAEFIETAWFSKPQALILNCLQEMFAGLCFTLVHHHVEWVMKPLRLKILCPMITFWNIVTLLLMKSY